MSKLSVDSIRPQKGFINGDPSFIVLSLKIPEGYAYPLIPAHNKNRINFNKIHELCAKFS